MVDQEFKDKFQDMTKLITKTYANWERYEEGDKVFQPFLRTFDAYVGHSWAGGTGDDGGNNQESTSEAINSAVGVFLLGVELQDERLTALGATLYTLESEATSEYWLDLTNENLPENYPRQYVGILGTGSAACQTYFDGDFAWALGIQAVPCDYYYNHFARPGMQRVFEAMIDDRIEDGKVGNKDIKAHIQQMEPYLGGYHLNILQNFNAPLARSIMDDLYATGGGWTNHINIAHDYYLANAFISYGHPAEGYHTSLASGAVYQNAAGQLTYLIYNPSNAAVDVKVYKGDNVIATINVAGRQYYNARA